MGRRPRSAALAVPIAAITASALTLANTKRFISILRNVKAPKLAAQYSEISLRLVRKSHRCWLSYCWYDLNCADELPRCCRDLDCILNPNASNNTSAYQSGWNFYLS